jgi:rare lipoprotein A
MPIHRYLPKAYPLQRSFDLSYAFIKYIKHILGLIPARYRIKNRADLHRNARQMIATAALIKWPLCVLCISLLGLITASGCSPNKMENNDGAAKKVAQTEASTPAKAVKKEVGVASWYGPGFHGKETANGETFDQKELTAAHPTLPMDTKAKVTNLDNGKKVEVRINDRGPFTDNRVIDLSKAAAKKLDMKQDGTTPVKIETKTVKKKSAIKKTK